MKNFTLSDSLLETLHIDEMKKVIEMCEPNEGYTTGLICNLIGLFLKKYYAVKIKGVIIESECVICSRESYVEGFTPDLSLKDILLFLIEKNIIQECKDIQYKYKLIKN
jgi:hypothetical protein